MQRDRNQKPAQHTYTNKIISNVTTTRNNIKNQIQPIWETNKRLYWNRMLNTKLKLYQLRMEKRGTNRNEFYIICLLGGRLLLWIVLLVASCWAVVVVHPRPRIQRLQVIHPRWSHDRSQGVLVSGGSKSWPEFGGVEIQLFTRRSEPWIRRRDEGGFGYCALMVKMKGRDGVWLSVVELNKGGAWC